MSVPRAVRRVALAGLMAGGLAVAAATAAHAPGPGPQIAGRMYVVAGGDMLIDLHDGHLALMDLALVLSPGQDLGAEGSGDPDVRLPRGPDARRRDGRIRATIIDILGGATIGDLASPARRARVDRAIISALDRKHAVRVERVVWSDLALR